MDNWVVVVDSDPVSKRQYEVCAALRPAGLGAVDCAQLENADAELCSHVTHFPAFCNSVTNQCVYGLRETLEDINALEPPTRTTDPPPPPQTPQE